MSVSYVFGPQKKSRAKILVSFFFLQTLTNKHSLVTVCKSRDYIIPMTTVGGGDYTDDDDDTVAHSFKRMVMMIDDNFDRHDGDGDDGDNGRTTSS